MNCYNDFAKVWIHSELQTVSFSGKNNCRQYADFLLLFTNFDADAADFLFQIIMVVAVLVYGLPTKNFSWDRY